MNQCDLCETRWDPRSQEHRRGVDCAQAFHSQLINLEKSVKRLELAIQSVSGHEKEAENATVRTLKQQHVDLGVLQQRFENLAKRVNQLEHPALKNVRSMPGHKSKDGSGD